MLGEQDMRKMGGLRNKIRNTWLVMAVGTYAIAGFPFLTQLVSGKYDDIHVTADDVTVADGSTSLRIAQLDVTLHHVTVSRDFTSARSQYGTATALVHYADLAQLLGTQLSYAGAGRVRASAQVGVVPGSGRSGKTQRRHAVSPGRMVIVTP